MYYIERGCELALEVIVVTSQCRKRPEKTARTFWFLLALLITLIVVTLDWILFAGDLRKLNGLINYVLTDENTPSLIDRIVNYNARVYENQAGTSAGIWFTASDADVGPLVSTASHAFLSLSILSLDLS